MPEYESNMRKVFCDMRRQMKSTFCELSVSPFTPRTKTVLGCQTSDSPPFPILMDGHCLPWQIIWRKITQILDAISTPSYMLPSSNKKEREVNWEGTEQVHSFVSFFQEGLPHTKWKSTGHLFWHQRPKNPVSTLALPTGKFLRVRKACLQNWPQNKKNT